MFIDITRYGGKRVLPVAVAAIAYLDEVEGGTALHLIGGETIRANEDVAEIKARCTSARASPLIDPALDAAADEALEAVGLISATEAATRRAQRVIDRNAAQGYPAKRGGRGRGGQ